MFWNRVTIGLIFMPFIYHPLVFVCYGVILRLFYLLKKSFDRFISSPVSYVCTLILFVIIAMHLQTYVFALGFHVIWSLLSGAPSDENNKMYKFNVAPPYIWDENSGSVINVDTTSLKLNLFVGWLIVVFCCIALWAAFEPQWSIRCRRRVGDWCGCGIYKKKKE